MIIFPKKDVIPIIIHPICFNPEEPTCNFKGRLFAIASETCFRKCLLRYFCRAKISKEMSEIFIHGEFQITS